MSKKLKPSLVAVSARTTDPLLEEAMDLELRVVEVRTMVRFIGAVSGACATNAIQLNEVDDAAAIFSGLQVLSTKLADQLDGVEDVRQRLAIAISSNGGAR